MIFLHHTQLLYKIPVKALYTLTKDIGKNLVCFGKLIHILRNYSFLVHKYQSVQFTPSWAHLCSTSAVVVG